MPRVTRTVGVAATAVLLTAAARPLRAQESAPIDLGRALGRIIAATVVLAADDFAAAGRYSVDDGAADSTFRLRGFGYRHEFGEPTARLRPALAVHVGRSTFEERITAFGAPFDDATTSADVAEVEAFLRRSFEGGLWVEPFVGLIDSRTTQETTRRNPLRVELAPVLDGRILDWQASAWTATGGVAAGVDRETASGRRFHAGASVTAARTDPRTTDDPLQDVGISTVFGRLSGRLEVPLAVRLRDRALRLDLGLAVTWLDDELAEPLDGDRLIESRLALRALRPGGARRPWPPALGLAVSYTRAQAFDGWSFGVVVSP